MNPADDLPPELLDLLQAQRGEGQVESSGVFTVDLQRARARLTQLYQAAPSFYLLKFVQLGVVLGCESVRIRTGDPLTVTLTEPLWDFPDLGEVRRAILEAVPLTDEGPVGYLSAGLLACLATEPDLVVWSAWRGLEGETLQVSPQGLVSTFTDRPPGFGSWVARRLVLLVRGARQRNRAQEQASVRSRCGYSPVPVYLNHEQVSGSFWGTERPNPGNNWRYAERYRLQPDGPGLGVPGPKRRGARLTLDSGGHVEGSADGDLTRLLLLDLQGTALLDARQVRADLCVALLRGSDLSTTGPGTVLWVKDGVACQALPEDLGIPGALAVVDAAGMRVDASQFQLVRNQGYEDRLREVRHQVRSLAETVVRNLKHIPEPDGRAQTLLGAGQGTCLGCLLGLLMPALLPMAFMAGAGTGAMVGGASLSHRDRQQRDELKRYLEGCLRLTH